LVYTDASDGVTSSTIYTDYVNIELFFKSITGYDLLIPYNNRRDSGLDTLISYKQDGTTATNFITGTAITPSLIQYQDHTDIYWKADTLVSVPSKVWITSDQSLGTGTIIYQVSRDGGITFTNVIKDTLTDISSQPTGQNLVIKATITGNAVLNAISWGWK
jgi:Neuraminidase (sialidase)